MIEFSLNKVFSIPRVTNGFNINRQPPNDKSKFLVKAKLKFHKTNNKTNIVCVNTFIPCPICAMGYKPNHEYNVAVYKTSTSYSMVRIEENTIENELATYLACFETININPYSIKAGKEYGTMPVYFVKDFNYYINQMKNKIILLSS